MVQNSCRKAHTIFMTKARFWRRLVTGLLKRNQEVVFLVGSPLSAPSSPGAPGVPDVEGVIELIRREFAGDDSQLAMFTEALGLPGSNRYQKAFLFLQGRRGQQN